MKIEIEKAIRRICFVTEVNIEIKDFWEGKPFKETMIRAIFEDVFSNLFNIIIKRLQKVLDDNRIIKFLYNID